MWYVICREREHKHTWKWKIRTENWISSSPVNFHTVGWRLDWRDWARCPWQHGNWPIRLWLNHTSRPRFASSLSNSVCCYSSPVHRAAVHALVHGVSSLWTRDQDRIAVSLEFRERGDWNQGQQRSKNKDKLDNTKSNKIIQTSSCRSWASLDLSEARWNPT